jgi:hypothetical protein
MQCQREGCDSEALYGVQIMSARGYRVGLCRDCAVEELLSIGVTDSLDLLDSVYSNQINHCDWWRFHFYYDDIDALTFDRLQKEKLFQTIMKGVE